MESSIANVPDIKILIDESNVIEGARVILEIIRPHWIGDHIKFKLFTDGITNKLVGCFYPHKPHDTGLKLAGNSAGTSNRDDSVVLVRVYGNKTDLLIDRAAETRNIRLLHSYGLAPNLYATFKNGLAYEFVHGVTLTPESVIEPKVWQLVARKMAAMHRVDCGSSVPKVAGLKAKMEQFLALLPQKFSDPEKEARALILPIASMPKIFYNLYDRLKLLNSPVVFAHNDLLLGNVIYTEALNRVTFIDYEYSGYNHQAYDIGNHFTEFAGIDDVDYTQYPSKDFQLAWLRVYLEAFEGDREEISERKVENLFIAVNQFALAAHLLWTVWGLIQAEHSTIDFDFMRFAETRFEEFQARKTEFLSLLPA